MANLSLIEKTLDKTLIPMLRKAIPSGWMKFSGMAIALLGYLIFKVYPEVEVPLIALDVHELLWLIASGLGYTGVASDRIEVKKNGAAANG